jgi:hypothetical protein
MTTGRRSTAAPILASLAIVLPLVLLSAYVAGYLWLAPVQIRFSYVGESADGPPDMIREFPTYSLRRVYEPAGKVESWLRGKKVDIWHKL